MTKPIRNIKRVVFYSTFALALTTIAGAANSHVCMKKPYGQGYSTPMHPHHMRGFSGPMKPYGYPPQGYPAPVYPKDSVDKADKSPRQYDETQNAASDTTEHARTPDIIETATAAGDFDTLIKAVVAADLYDTLRGDGPFTLFAPTDDAFANLPDGMLDEWLADKDKLVAVLGHHVVPGRLTAADLLKQREVKTVQGENLSITALDVVSADIETANGIVHVIGTVVMPSP